MFPFTAGVRSRVTAPVAAVLLLVSQARAVDFLFLYDDPPGFGFFDPTIPPTSSTTLGEQRRAALEAAGDIWGKLIRPSYFGEEIAVLAKFDPLATGMLASAKPHYYYSDFGSSSSQYQGDTNYPKALANHLAGRDLAPQRHEIDITVNETVTTFYYPLDGMATASQRDFVTVMAHELGHGLGFTSSFQDDGDYGLLGDGIHYDPDPACDGCLPTPYDRFLTLGTLGQTLLSLSDDDARESALISSNVFWNGANAITGNSGSAPEIEANAPFTDGSSTSHLDPLMNTSTRPILMPPGYLGVRQSLSALERGMMRDLGWNISVTPSQVNWTGLGADDNGSTAANWSPGLPLPGDRLAFGPSPRTNVHLDLTLYSISNISFVAGAPAYTLTFDRQKSTDITGSGITNLSSQTQTIVVENGFAHSPDQSGATVTFKNGTSAGNAVFEVLGGGTSIESPPNLPPRYVRGAGGQVIFEGNARAGSARFTVEGGTGAEGPQGRVIFRGTSSAGIAQFHNKSGRIGVRLPAGFASGHGGETRFEGSSTAGTSLARFRNDGDSEGADGTSGTTTFADSASAGDATFENFGAASSAGFSGKGGVTHFLDESNAGTAEFINRVGSTNGPHSGGRTEFWNDARAGTATFTNVGDTVGFQRGGVTRFHDNSTAEESRFVNLGGSFHGGFGPGTTEFYDDATAGNGTFLYPFNPPDSPTPVGSGRTDFFDRSNAGPSLTLPRSNFTFQAGPAPNSQGGGGIIWFHDDSTAGRARFTFEPFSKGVINFSGRANAGEALFDMQDRSFGQIVFNQDSNAANREYNVTANGAMHFLNRANAANSTITVANGGAVTFGTPELLTDIATAGDATIRVMGGSVNNPPGVPTSGRLRFNPGSSAGNATITTEGSIGANGVGGRTTFVGGNPSFATTAGNATLIVHGGTGGGQGGIVTFGLGALGGTAALVANAGGTFDFSDQRSFGGTQVGSIEGAGTFILQGSLLTTGTRNTSTIVSGAISDGGTPGGMLTKVGTGTLTLAGANTYSGLTTVAGGTLRVDGSIAGDVLVKSGARLEGTGVIPNMPTVEGGGVFASGTSPGTITIGGLTMMPGGVLEFEIGDPLRDHIVLTGNGNITLDGILKLSLLDGFMPTLGQSFALFEGAIGSITGAFDTILAPTFNGLTFDVVQNAGSVLLQVGEATLLPGDFNADGSVDAADYVVWRKNGAAQDSYNFWRANFGRSAGSGAAARVAGGSVVPEPSSALLLLISFVGICFSARRRLSRFGDFA